MKQGVPEIGVGFEYDPEKPLLFVESPTGKGRGANSLHKGSESPTDTMRFTE